MISTVCLIMFPVMDKRYPEWLGIHKSFWSVDGFGSPPRAHPDHPSSLCNPLQRVWNNGTEFVGWSLSYYTQLEMEYDGCYRFQDDFGCSKLSGCFPECKK